MATVVMMMNRTMTRTMTTMTVLLLVVTMVVVAHRVSDHPYYHTMCEDG
jgi:hypothetical protein